MKKSLLLLLLISFILCVNAQEEKSESKKPPSQEMETVMLAKQLAKYGYQHFSATALVEAARILSTVKTQDLKYDSAEKGSVTDDGKEKENEIQLEISKILETAKTYARNDKDLLASIDQIEKSLAQNRGRVGGPGEVYGKVGANVDDRYTVKFWSDELAEIALVGDGDTDLDLYVYDENGNLIDKDDDYTDDCYVSWVPRWTGLYIIKIVNRGSVYNRYYLVTN